MFRDIDHRRIARSIQVATAMGCSVLLCACGQTTVAQPTGLVTEVITPEILYVESSLPAAVYDPLIHEFEQRTGIWVEQVPDETADDATPDVILTNRRQDAGVGAQVSSGEIWCEEPIVIIYNPHVLRTAPPTGWTSLLDSKWKGRIAFGDAASDETSSAAMLQIAAAEAREDAVGQFYENLCGETIDDPDEIIHAVANEEDYIGITTEDQALRAMAQEIDIAMVYPEEGTTFLYSVIEVRQDSEAARQLTSFLLSEDARDYAASELAVRVPGYDRNETRYGLLYGDLPSITEIVQGGTAW